MAASKKPNRGLLGRTLEEFERRQAEAILEPFLRMQRKQVDRFLYGDTSAPRRPVGATPGPNITAESEADTTPPLKTRRAKRGPKLRLITDSLKMNERAISEAEQLFLAGKSIDDVMDELGFSDDGDPNQKYRKKLRRLELWVNESSS
jgi:hypothetical protein